MSDHVPYPRPTPPPIDEVSWSRKALGCLIMFCGTGGCCLFLIPWMVVDAPRKPNGDIEGASRATLMIWLIVSVSVIVVAFGAFLLRPIKKKVNPTEKTGADDQ